MNWGKSIIVVLVVFMSFIGFLAYKMATSKEDAFDKDYYEKGLAFDKEYDLKQQVITDGAAPFILLNDSSLNIQFKALDEGEIRFKRPSDQAKDFTLNLGSKTFSLSKKKLDRGDWRMVINWSDKGKKYLFEKKIFVP